MKPRAWTERTHARRIAGRMFWALLVLIHIPALFGATQSLLASPDILHGLSLLALVATVGCFVSKLCGVQFLPHGTAPGRAVVFVVIAAMVHHEAAATAAQRVIESPAIPVAVATTLAVSEVVRRTRRHLPGLKSRLAALLASHCSVRYVRGLISTFDIPRLRSAFISRLAIPRAPPA